MKKKLIITGAAGLVGMNLMSKLDYSKYDVIAIDRNETNLNIAKELFPKIKIVCADVVKKGDWEKYFGKDIYCVIQLQAQISSPKEEPYIRNNINSVKKVMEVCERTKIKKMIHLSSSVVISVADDYYTRTKRKGEELVKSSKVPHTIFRPSLMYGCFDIKHLGYLTSLLEISPIFPVPGSGKYMRQPVYVENMCDIIINSIERPAKNKIYNIIGKEKIDFIDLMKKIARLKKLKRLFLNIPIPIFIFLIRVYGVITGQKPFVPDQLKALVAGDEFPVINWEKEFNTKYVQFEDGIKKMLKSPYYKYRKQMKKIEK